MWRFSKVGVGIGAVLISLQGYCFDEKAALKESQAAIGREIRGYTLRDASGAEVRLEDLRGKPLVVHFVYTGCFQVCPASTQILASPRSASTCRSTRRRP
jgi:cytochrome oxidase Cu insertion factor (SCO1/SenC/PrrC family)